VAHTLQKIQLAMVTDDAPVPPIMQVIRDAYRVAQQRRYLSFVLTEEPTPTGDAPEAAQGSSSDVPNRVP
jgi:hypothetical protein